MKTLVRTKPAHFNSIFDEFFNDWSHGSMVKNASISTNVIESDESYSLEIVAPGFQKEDFELNIDNEVLSIAVEKETEKLDEGKKYTRREYQFSGFKRSFNLPENTIDTDKVEATYDSGVLKVSLPKREEALPKPIKRIDIS